MRMRGKWVAAILLAGVCSGYVPQMPGCMRAQLPKRGRVVDRTTGEGVPNAVVIVAEETVNFGGLFVGGSSSFNYRSVVATDNAGFFETPSHFLGLSFESYVPCWMSASKCEEIVFIGVFKPGWALSDDVDYLSEATESSRRLPPSVVQGVHTWIDSGTFLIEPVQAGLKAAGMYYGRVASLGITASATALLLDKNPATLDLIRRPGNAYFTDVVCHLSSYTKLDADEVKAATLFIHYDNSFNAETGKFAPSKFIRALSDIEQNGFDRDFPRGRIRYKPYYSEFQAGTVCALMQKIGAEL